MKRWGIKRLEKQNPGKKRMGFSYMNTKREYEWAIEHQENKGIKRFCKRKWESFYR